MSRTRTTAPPSSFDPRFSQLFDLALQRAVDIHFDTAGRCIKFRHVLHQFRASAKQHEVPGWQRLYEVTTQISPDKRRLIVRPVRDQFNSVFKRIGVDDPTPPADISAELQQALQQWSGDDAPSPDNIPSDVPSSASAIDDFMKSGSS